MVGLPVYEWDKHYYIELATVACVAPILKSCPSLELYFFKFYLILIFCSQQL